MTRDELEQAAIDCLGDAMAGNKVSGSEIPPHVVHAALTVLVTPKPRS